MQDLMEYPAAIAKVQRQLFHQEQYCRRVQEQLERLNLGIEQAIAFNTELKNDAQRKATRAELMAEPEYVLVRDQWQAAQDKRTELLIELDLLRNSFSALKLHLRCQLAWTAQAVDHAA